MYISNSNVHEIINAIEGFSVQKNETVLIMLSEHQLPDIPHLISELNSRKIEFFGAIFPGLIYGSEKYDTGAIIQVLPVIQHPVLIQGISKSPKDLEKLLHPFRSICNKNAAAFIIVDGASSNISSFLSSLFSLFADSVEYLGCGAGFLEMEPGPSVFTPDGFFQDAAVISFLDMHCSLGVHHGWEKAIGPLVVTKSDGNRIKELNWRNALEVYKEAVESDRGAVVKEGNFLEITAHYPFGIYIEGHEDLMRVILQITSEGELICAGDVSENAVLYIMKGDIIQFVRSAEKTVEDCFFKGNENIMYCLVIDCVGRSIYLQESFKEELRAIKKGLEVRNIHVVPEGVLSVGEIASMGEDMLEFFNYTIVMGIFHEPACTIHRNL